ncbi:MAG: tetratricopeptide repeat protein [Flavobacteriales bacterium]|jgi:tetratricopeptide (TPR) repeat protein
MSKGLLLFLLIGLALTSCKSVSPPSYGVEPITIQDFHSATRSYLKGDYETAEKTLVQLLQKAPSHSASYYLLAKINVVKKNYDAVKKNLMMATEHDPTNQYYVSELAFLHSQSGEYKEAARLFMTLVKKENPNPIHYLGAYENLSKAKAYSKALAVVDEQEDKFGITPTTVLQRFNTLLAMGKERPAEEFLAETITSFRDDPLLLSTLIDFYLEKRDAQKAMPLLKLLCETDPKNGMAKWLYGQFLLHSSDSLRAFSILKDAVALEGPSIEQKSELLLKLQQTRGCTKETREITESFVAGNPREVVGYTLLGDLYVQCGEIDRAQRCYQQALELNPNAYPIWAQRLFLLFTESKWDVLELESEKCLTLFPVQAFPYLADGIAKNKLGKSGAALKTLKTGQNYLTGKGALKVEFLFQSALANASLGNTKAAINNFNSAFALDPNNNSMKLDALVEIIDAPPFFPFSDSLLSICKQEGLSDEKAQTIVGRRFYVTQQYEKALTHLSKVVQEGGDWWVTFQWIGDCHEKLGNKNSATLYWNKAKEIKMIKSETRNYIKYPK